MLVKLMLRKMANFAVCNEFKRKINKINLMYKVSKNIKIFSLALMIIGALGLAFSFYSAPKTIEQAKEMVADSHSDGHHEVESIILQRLSFNVDSKVSRLHEEDDTHSSFP